MNQLRWITLAVLNKLFPPERPSDDDLILLGVQQERERSERKIREIEERYQQLLEETPTTHAPYVKLPSVPPSPTARWQSELPTQPAEAIARWHARWCREHLYMRYQDGDGPETEQSLAAQSD